MDWIETIFGISPDGGSGATEMLYILAGAIALALFLARRRIAGAYLDLKARRRS